MDTQLLDLFRELTIKHRETVSGYLKQYGVYLGQHRVIFSLRKNPNITLTQLTELLDVSKESLSVSIKRLDASGFIHKENDPKDKRRILLSLSDEGEEVAKACRAGFETINTSMFSSLDSKEKKILSSLFEKMIASLESEVTP